MTCLSCPCHGAELAAVRASDFGTVQEAIAQAQEGIAGNGVVGDRRRERAPRCKWLTRAAAWATSTFFCLPALLEAYAPQLPMRPPSFLVITIVAERGRLPAP